MGKPLSGILRLSKTKLLLGFVLLTLCVTSSFVIVRYLEAYTSDFIDHTIYSSVLNENRKIFIRLPDGYNKNKRYSLVIKSDGNFNLKRWDETLKELASQNNPDNSIVVAIPNLFWQDTRNRDLVPPYARKDVNIEARPKEDNNSEIFGKADLFLAFIETELIPYIERNYSINKNRILSGFSAGGSFVLYTIVTKPSLFNGYFAFSPAAWYDKSVVVTEFEKHLPNTSGTPIFLYLSLGTEENKIITESFKGLLNALDKSAPANLQWAHSYSAEAGHVENPNIALPKAIRQFHQFKKNNVNLKIPLKNLFDSN